MKIFLIAYGKLKTPGTRELTDYYLRNVKPWIEVTEVELQNLKLSGKNDADRELVRKNEAETLRTFIQKKKSRQSKLILLDEKGLTLSTQKYSAKIETWMNTGVSELFFCIGSAYGFSEELKKEADLLMSFGAQTISHEIARGILAEQIYRIFSVIKKHPYHNEG